MVEYVWGQLPRRKHDDAATDPPLRRAAGGLVTHETAINGVTVTPLIVNTDPRG
jgi:hypothetical protein